MLFLCQKPNLLHFLHHPIATINFLHSKNTTVSYITITLLSQWRIAVFLHTFAFFIAVRLRCCWRKTNAWGVHKAIIVGWLAVHQLALIPKNASAAAESHATATYVVFQHRRPPRQIVDFRLEKRLGVELALGNRNAQQISSRTSRLAWWTMVYESGVKGWKSRLKLISMLTGFHKFGV